MFRRTQFVQMLKEVIALWFPIKYFIIYKLNLKPAFHLGIQWTKSSFGDLVDEKNRNEDSENNEEKSKPLREFHVFLSFQCHNFLLEGSGPYATVKISFSAHNNAKTLMAVKCVWTFFFS